MLHVDDMLSICMSTNSSLAWKVDVPGAPEQLPHHPATWPRALTQTQTGQETGEQPLQVEAGWHITLRKNVAKSLSDTLNQHIEMIAVTYKSFHA